MTTNNENRIWSSKEMQIDTISSRLQKKKTKTNPRSPFHENVTSKAANAEPSKMNYNKQMNQI